MEPKIIISIAVSYKRFESSFNPVIFQIAAHQPTPCHRDRDPFFNKNWARQGL